MELSEVVLTTALSVLAALLALLGIAWQVKSAAQANNKNVFVATITTERAKWRDDLRLIAAEFSKLSYAQLEAPSKEHLLRLHELRLLIRFRLNPNPTHVLDASILSAIEDVMEKLPLPEPQAMHAALGTMEDSVQKILKQEWEKSKREAKTGEVEVVDAQQGAPAD